MIRNNLLMVVLQVFLSLFWMGFMLLVDWSKGLEEFFYGNWITRLVLIGLVMLVYYLLGKLLKKNLSFVEVLFSGILSFSIACVFFFLAFIGEGQSLLDGSVASSLWRFPMDFYLLPQMYTVHLLGLAGTWTGYGVALGMGSLIMELSLISSYMKYRRLKRSRRDRKE